MRIYPCDSQDADNKHSCPFADEFSGGSYMYFCRDHCGLGVDESEVDEPSPYVKRYSDCYDQCGGEDCACCEIHMDHQADARYPRDSDDYSPEWDFERRGPNYMPDDDDCDEDCDDCPFDSCECRRIHPRMPSMPLQQELEQDARDRYS